MFKRLFFCTSSMTICICNILVFYTLNSEAESVKDLRKLKFLGNEAQSLR